MARKTYTHRFGRVRTRAQRDYDALVERTVREDRRRIERRSHLARVLA